MISEELVFSQTSYLDNDSRAGAIIEFEDSVSICYRLDGEDGCCEGDEADWVVVVEVEVLSCSYINN
jgi:hypothetical protein